MAWVDEEPASLVSRCLTHPLRGWGEVDESRRGTAGRVGTNSKWIELAMLIKMLVPQTAAAILVVPRGGCASVCLLFPSVLSLLLWVQ